MLANVLTTLALAAAVAAVAVSADRRAVAARVGVAIAVAGVVIVAGETVSRPLLLNGVSDPDDRAAAAAVWDAFLGDLRTTGLLLAASGAVLAAASASLIRPIEVEQPLRTAWRIVSTEPDATLARVARAAVLVACGVLLIAQPAAALRIAVTLVGVYVVYKGVEAFLRLINRPADRAATAGPSGRERRRARVLAVPVAATLLVAAVLAAFLAGGGVDEPCRPCPAATSSKR